MPNPLPNNHHAPNHPVSQEVDDASAIECICTKNPDGNGLELEWVDTSSNPVPFHDGLLDTLDHGSSISTVRFTIKNLTGDEIKVTIGNGTGSTMTIVEFATKGWFLVAPKTTIAPSPTYNDYIITIKAIGGLIWDPDDPTFYIKRSGNGEVPLPPE